MDIKTITATLALLGSGIPLTACDSGDKPAKEADKAEKKDDAKKDGAKADAKKDDAKAEAKGEMACGEGKCGAGGCGGKKDDKALADGDEKDGGEAKDAPKADEDADKS